MKVTVEVPTAEIRRLLDATSGDTNLRHVPMEQLVAEAAKRGIIGWEFYAHRRSYPDAGPLKGSIDALVETCDMLVQAWEERDRRDPQPDFAHIYHAVKNLRAAGYRR